MCVCVPGSIPVNARTTWSKMHGFPVFPAPHCAGVPGRASRGAPRVLGQVARRPRGGVFGTPWMSTAEQSAWGAEALSPWLLQGLGPRDVSATRALSLSPGPSLAAQLLPCNPPCTFPSFRRSASTLERRREDQGGYSSGFRMGLCSLVQGSSRPSKLSMQPHFSVAAAKGQHTGGAQKHPHDHLEGFPS